MCELLGKCRLWFLIWKIDLGLEKECHLWFLIWKIDLGLKKECHFWFLIWIIDFKSGIRCHLWFLMWTINFNPEKRMEHNLIFRAVEYKQNWKFAYVGIIIINNNASRLLGLRSTAGEKRGLTIIQTKSRAKKPEENLRGDIVSQKNPLFFLVCSIRCPGQDGTIHLKYKLGQERSTIFKFYWINFKIECGIRNKSRWEKFWAGTLSWSKP